LLDFQNHTLTRNSLNLSKEMTQNNKTNGRNNDERDLVRDFNSQIDEKL